MLKVECAQYILADPVVSPATASNWISDAYENGCHISQKEPLELISCTYGDPLGKSVVALVGDSHATQWLPAFDLVGKELGLQIRTNLMSGCSFGGESNAQECNLFNDCVTSELLSNSANFDAIYISNRVTTSLGLSRLEERVEVFSAVLERLSSRGYKVFVVEDIPLGSLDNSDPNVCLLQSSPSDCTNARLEHLDRFQNPYTVAAERANMAGIVETAHLFCFSNECLRSSGGVPVYRDDDHLSLLYAESTASFWINEFRSW